MHPKPSLLALIALLACAPAATTNTSGAGGGAGFDLLVLSTTDVHGRIRAWDYYADSAESNRGLARLATLVDSIRTANAGRVLLVDAGDLLQGNPFAYVAMKQPPAGGNPIVGAMNALAYDAAAIGNHEYNYGVPYLERAVSQARFAFLSANTYRPDGKHAFRAWTIVQRQGVRIGIVGATTPGVMVWDAENVKGRIRVGDIIPGVRSAVQEARAAGAEVMVVTMHAGLNEPASYDTAATGLPSENVASRVAAEIPGIDLIVYGHSHKEQKDLHIGSTLLVQPKNWATSLGVATLRLTKQSGRWKVASSRGQTLPAAGQREHAGIIGASNSTHQATVAYANTVIGFTRTAWHGDSARLRDTPLIDLILEVQRKATGADLSSTAAFTLDAKLDTGSITVAEMARLYPYDNTLRVVKISGKQLRDYLEFSSRYYTGIIPVGSGPPITNPQIPGYNYDIIAGADYILDLTKPVGSRVTKLTVKGKAVTPTDSFTLALNNYRQSGGGGFSMLQGAPVVYDKQEEIRELLINEVTRRQELKPADFFTQNWSLIYPGSRAATGSSSLAPGTPRLRIIATNDFHGALEPRPDANGVQRGGAAYVASMIESARNECAPTCEVLLLDGGDMFQGTIASNMAYGRPVVDYYNRVGYAAAALGNHEFDWGVDTLRARMRQAKFAILGANVRFANGRDVPWIRDDTLITRGSMKIGVIGISSQRTPTNTLPSNVRGLRFDAPAPVVDQRARDLRGRGADVVVVVAHDGAFCDANGTEACRGEIIDMANALTEKVDAIVSGHTHSIIDYSVKGIPIVQARTAGTAIGVLDIPLTGTRPSGEGVVDVRSVTTSSITPSAGIDSLVRRASSRVATLVSRRVGTLRTALDRTGNQYPLGNLIADAQRWAGKGDIAIMNNGGIRAGIRAGPLTYGALFEVQPFANTLYRVRMTGAQVKEYLEKVVARDELREHVSGVVISYNPQLPKGQRITSLRLPDGRTLSDAAMYNVIVSNFLATGGVNMGPPEGARLTPLDIVDLDALVDYISSLPSPLAVPSEARIMIMQ
ncbi:MAG TPA: 5'-nucleotidase C-terminal domain-containing protein [Gemmatimonadaceae bacterium]|nr:5'-nucleotidase C-terminal domain-containing protein [Gemmatimonadaceae bacterium]